MIQSTPCVYCDGTGWSFYDGYRKVKCLMCFGHGVTYKMIHDAAPNHALELAAVLHVILDQVDYTQRACRPVEMVAAVLPVSTIERARATLAAYENRP